MKARGYQYHFIGQITILCSAILLLVGCSNNEKLTKLESINGAGKNPVNFGILHPTLATRNTACIMCHARIDGDLVTDFGYGNSFFMGTDRPQNHPNQISYYSPFASKHFIWDKHTWEDSSVMGNIYVPDTTVGDARLLTAYNAVPTNPGYGALLPLVQFLENPFRNPTTNSVVDLIKRSTSPDINVPGLRGQFVARKQVWIDAPTEEEIESLMFLSSSRLIASEMGATIFAGTPSAQVSGLIIKQSTVSMRSFVTTDPVLSCRGDVIIDGVVLLKNLVLDTDGGGCRLYVTGTVFIQGPLTYLGGDDGDKNLQITSATAIVMGMKTMSTRFAEDTTSSIVGGLRRAWTDDQEMIFNQKIVDDRSRMDGLVNDAGPFKVEKVSGVVVGYQDDLDTKEWTPVSPNFMDPSLCGDPAAGAPCAIDWAGAFMRKSIDFKHVLLNAPKVHSRYYGTVHGVIIGEDVLFAIGNFQFKSDPVMNRVPLLPLMGGRIFNMSED